MLLFVTVSALVGCSGSEESVHRDGTSFRRDTLAQSASNIQSMSYVFKQGDQLRVSLRGFPEFDTTVVVNENGTFPMRLIGDVNAGGASRAQVTEDLKVRLRDYIATDVQPTIIVMNTLVQKVAVLGAVLKQDNYSIGAEATLLQVLAMAGGATAESDLQHIRIFRNGDEGNAEEIDLTRYITTGGGVDVTIIRPGDIVYVPREENIIRELSSFFRDTIFLFTLFTISN